MDMDIKYIKDLLEKFYEGTSSQEEEGILSEFFNSGESIPQDMEADRRMFAVLSDPSKYAMPPADLQEKIMEAVDNSPITKTVTGTSLRRKRFSRISIASFAAAAAVIAFFMLAPFSAGVKTDTVHAPNQLASSSYSDTVDTNINLSEPVAELEGKEVAEDVDSSTRKNNSIGKGIKSQPHRAVARTAISSETIPELTEEEQLAFEAGMKALARAGEQMAYASDRLESTDESLRNIYSTIQDKLK